ncbi:hypothetical protein DSO57_1018610 [Entomophthora muscae]|uniref:Uncharacterized protein n=1 Tax=Entomophthora muscae TaxID=34485 RepID=A0ACC2RVH1_9FUNG|nr:hypothetical protein DSO57_1018610 [Entomophthora muscae]
MLRFWLAVIWAVHVSCLVEHCVDGDVCFKLQDVGEEVEFAFTYPQEYGWVGLGIGVWMQGSDMMIVWQANDGTFIVSDRKSFNYNEPKTDASQDCYLLPDKTNSTDGKTNIVFRRLKNTKDPNDTPLTSANTDFVWAYSKIRPLAAANAELKVHEDSGKFNLALGSGQSKQSFSGSFKLAHGVLLLFGWNLIPYAGILAAAPLRPKLGVHWFRIHYFLLGMLAPALVISGIAIISSGKGRHFSTPHEILGLAVALAMLLQIFLGIAIHLTYNPLRTKVTLTATS